MNAVAVNPMRCRLWSLHSRLEETLTEESCRDEIASFEREGQLIPVLGRRVRNAPGFDVELIYGARRLFVARHLNVPLQVEIREISDKEGIIVMDAENRLRKDISPYERGLGYARWLREGHFQSQSEIVNALQISHAKVSRLLKLARLPKALVDAFATPSDIREAWGERLGRLTSNPHMQRQMLETARELAAAVPRLPAAKVFARLCAAAKASRTTRAPERTITGEQGEPLFRVKHQQGTVMFTVPLDNLSRELLTDIERELARVMDDSTIAGRKSASRLSTEAFE
jgi:ParB family transcriptional regulator, chromosome partitioning protein